jgi:hypothetical protein
MGARWRAWSALPLRQRLQLSADAIALPMIAVSLRLLGHARTRRWLARAVIAATPPADAIDQARARARLVAIAARHGPFRATCLHQSLRLQALLRRRGLDAQLKFGVRRDGTVIEAHAWVELAGVDLLDARRDHHALERVG